eukprot:TRINITY_DN6070_c0_g1_i8.p1 TRINITY_DN6070_c0_g1~~TRINITY_DN6070_c0_g1_i8.p1  ORF type:complete len:723 (-),score=108.25 TRINITY_DN6070_c0_g1_i8:497-2665(-)
MVWDMIVTEGPADAPWIETVPWSVCSDDVDTINGALKDKDHFGKVHDACRDENVKNAATHLDECVLSGEEHWKESCKYKDRVFSDIYAQWTTTECKYFYAPPRWHAYVVIFFLAIAIVFIIEGTPTEQALWCLVFYLCLLGVVSPKQVYEGLSKGSVIALALLFPIAIAIDETGALDRVIGLLLGNPQQLLVAMFRMMMPVALLSALLSNTAITAMMIPVIVAWSRRLNVHPGKLLMPLSFAAQLGGSCTLIGSSHVLVAAQAVKGLGYSMGFFDLAVIGVPLCLLTSLACGLFLPLLNPSLAAPIEEQPPPVAEGDEQRCCTGDIYNVYFIVDPRGGLANKTLLETGLARLPGVCQINRSSEEEVLQGGEELVCNCTAEGVKELRAARGLILVNHAELAMMGAYRKRRHLYEVTLYPSAPLLSAPKSAAHLRRVYGACIIAVRRPGCPVRWRVAGEHVLKADDVILLEADSTFLGKPAWAQNFSIVRQVPGSSPPRTTLDHDTPRALITCIGMLVLIISVTAEWVELDYGAGVFVMILLFSGALDIHSLYNSIKAPIILTIAAAFGVSLALQNSGVAYFVATSIMSVALKFGAAGVYAAVYVVAVLMSMFINNSATIAIVATMLPTMAETPGVELKYLTWTLVVAAGSCFTTPLGYQTNMMVSPDGGYAFGDFATYGAPIQVVHGVLTIVVILAFNSFGGSDDKAAAGAGAFMTMPDYVVL